MPTGICEKCGKEKSIYEIVDVSRLEENAEVTRYCLSCFRTRKKGGKK